MLGLGNSEKISVRLEEEEKNKQNNGQNIKENRALTIGKKEGDTPGTFFEVYLNLK